ncbi:PREDICTED: inactive protein RESTRICTED TEV MOVEMENT 2-like [Ipomoea nil]|uniref:inactive protein RESTRICTED TEV MOVEMENT 2-like n=1 Tax=Ipomoea nil TaxID=35883 RepID=UPI000901DCEB|nr:PREDICTED: inactive protein RESTRICTED TEV MOVEMENT 2-like [Ipomoea nil]
MSGIGGSRRRARPSNVIYEEMVPDFEWIEDPTNHWLGLEVPGFRREEVKLEVNTYGLIKIAGERKISEIKYIWFEQIFQAPENSKPEDCRVGMEEGLFYVQIPKKATQRVQASKTPRAEEEDDADHQKGKKVNDSGGGTTEKIPASTPTKPPRDDDEGSDHEKGKKVNDNGGGTTENIPASTPTKPPRDDEGSDLEKGKKVNDSGEFPNENEGTIETIPAATPLETPKDEEEEEDSIQEKGKKGNGNGDIPKGTSEEKEYDDAKGEEKSNGGNFLEKVAKRVKQNMGIFITVILILSAGVLVSQDNKRKKANSNDEILAKLDSQNHNDDE